MISSLRGTVLSHTSSSCELEVNGVGYLINLTAEHARGLVSGEEALISTSLIVREDSLTLFGFVSVENREIFDTLLSVSGVGPRSALAVLNTLSPAEIITAVLDENDAVFKKVSGIGPKTAKLIVVQLSGKLNLSSEPQHKSEKTHSVVSEQVVQALIGLGWNEKVAQKAVSEVHSDYSDTASLLRATLAKLSVGQK